MIQLSIIIPVYNVEKYLNHCIDSVVSQTFKDWILILIDDGSTDDSGKICDEYAKKDKRVIAIHQRNRGPAVARNLGLSLAKGEWVTFIDADDYIDPDGMEKMASAGEDVDMVISGKIIENGDKHKTIVPEETIITDEYPGALFLKSEIANSRDYIWNRFYKLSIIKKNNIRFETLKTGEDTLFNLEYTKYCNSIRILSFAYYHYVTHKGTLSSGFRPQAEKFLDKSIELYNQLYELSGNKKLKFKKFIDSIIIDNFHVDVGNRLYMNDIRNKHEFKDLVNYFDHRYKQDKDFIKVLYDRKDKSRKLNHKVQRFLLLHFPTCVFVYYNIIVGKLKNIREYA